MNAIKQLWELERMGSSMRLAAEKWGKPWKTLIATVLSARTRDEKTIPIAQQLFKRYRTAVALAGANMKDVQKIIKPINFYKTKSKNVIACAKVLVNSYNGKPPRNLEELLKLPGVGRKTANVFLSEMGKDVVATDTHVLYISKKLNWTKSDKPKNVENDLKKLFLKEYWSRINPILVRFGKTYTSRKIKDKLLEEIKKME